MNNDPEVRDDIKQEFRDLATRVCIDAKLDDEEWPSERDRLVRRWEHYYRQGADERLRPLEAKERATNAWGGLSRVTESLRDPWYVRWLSYKRCQPMRYFLIVLGILSVSILVLPTVAAFVVTGLAAYLTADVFKSEREIGWVRWLLDVVCRVVLVIFSLAGWLCLLVEKRGFWGPWAKALALWNQVRNLLSVRRVGLVTAQILCAWFFISLVVQHGGFPNAGSTRTIARADRMVPPDSSGSATTSISGPKLNSSFAKEESGAVVPDDSRPPNDMTAKPRMSSTVGGATVSTAKLDVNEASRTVTSSAEEKSGAVELNGSKPAGAIPDAASIDGLVASWLEPAVRNANEEPPPLTDLGVMRGGAGGEPAPSEIAGGNAVGSSPSSINAGATVSIAESKVNELATVVASPAKEDKRAIEPAGSKIAGGIADSPGSAGLVVPYLQPAVPKAGQTPLAPPTGLRISSSN
jgi:hypothetical protein